MPTYAQSERDEIDLMKKFWDKEMTDEEALYSSISLAVFLERLYKIYQQVMKEDAEKAAQK